MRYVSFRGDAMRHLPLLGLLLILILLPLQPQEAECCASVWRDRDDPVAIVEESAVIVWDSAKKVEHFIRWASFATKAQDFGFLVPTPTQPQLKEVAEGVFATLTQWTAPKIEHKRDWSFAPMFCLFGCAMAPHDASKSAAVRVLDRQIVGGFDAAVLEADNAEALLQWLEKHGYVARPELTAWLGPYIADHWKITAFKIAQEPGGGRAVQTSPVRMSFRTERPFFPYREPEEAKAPTSRRDPERLLRVFFIGEKRMRGLLGTTAWSARVPYSNPLDESQRTELVKSLGLEGR